MTSEFRVASTSICSASLVESLANLREQQLRYQLSSPSCTFAASAVQSCADGQAVYSGRFPIIDFRQTMDGASSFEPQEDDLFVPTYWRFGSTQSYIVWTVLAKCGSEIHLCRTYLSRDMDRSKIRSFYMSRATTEGFSASMLRQRMCW